MSPVRFTKTTFSSAPPLQVLAHFSFSQYFFLTVLFLHFISIFSPYFLASPNPYSAHPTRNKSDKIRDCISPLSSPSLKGVSCLSTELPGITYQTLVTFIWASCFHRILSGIRLLLTDCGLEKWRGNPRLSADCCYLCSPQSTVQSAAGKMLEEAKGFSLLGWLCISNVRLLYFAKLTMGTCRNDGVAGVKLEQREEGWINSTQQKGRETEQKVFFCFFLWKIEG